MRARAMLLLVVAFCPTGCASSSGNSAAAAAVFSAIALTSSAVSRAYGGCYSNCGPGTTCNELTGLCEELPCRNLCAADERCDAETNTCVEVVSSALAVEAARDLQRRAVLPEGMEIDACHPIDPETGLPALPLLPASQCLPNR